MGFREDKNGCVFFRQNILIVIFCFISHYAIAIPVITNVQARSGDTGCGNDGRITITATGTGTLFYAVKKTTDATYSSRQTGNVFDGLMSGTYKVMVYDDNGQTESTNSYTLNNKSNTSLFEITTPPQVTVDVISCEETGKITVKGQKGSNPYTYRILSGPTSKPDIVTNSSNAQSFTGLATGTYNIMLFDACGTTYYLNNIDVRSNNLGSSDLNVFEFNGPVTYTGGYCGITFTRDRSYIFLTNAGGDTLFMHGGNEVPSGSAMPVRLEYPAGSGNYTAWNNNLTSFSIPSGTYQADETAYRIQMRNPCNASDIVTSPIYHLIYPYDWRRTVCGYELFRQIPNYTCNGNVLLQLVNTVNSGQQFSFMWNGSGDAYTLDFSGIPDGTYHTSITTIHGTYPTADLTVEQEDYMDVGLVDDVVNYPMNRGCDFSTVGLRTTKVPSTNTIPITYTILSGPMNRPAVTGTQNMTLWDDLVEGTYTIRIDRGACGVNIVEYHVQPPVSGFDAMVSYTGGYICGLYRITGKGWYLDPDGNISDSDISYGVSVFDANTGIFMGTAATNVLGNMSFESAVDVPPGTYRVSFASSAPTTASCRYIDRYITISEPDLLTIDPTISGGLICADGYGTLHIGVTGGSGQPVYYRIRPAASQNENDYTAYQLSPDFYVQAGDYTVQVHDGCGSDSRNVSLTAGSVDANIIVAGTACEGTDVTLSLQVIGQITDVLWTLPGGGQLSGRTVTIRNLSSGDIGEYSVTFNSGGCSWTESVTLVVHPKPEFEFEAMMSTCQPVDLQSLNTISGDVSGLTMSYLNDRYTPVANPSLVETGTYHIIGTSSYGCMDTSTVSITVNPLATAGIIIANPVEKCTGLETTLTAAPLTSANIDHPVFRWYAGQDTDEVLHTGTDYALGIINVNVITTFDYYVSVSGDNYCENPKGSRKQVTLTVYPKPVVQIQTPGDINNLCHNSTIALNTTVTGGSAITWYGWYDRTEDVSNTVQFAPGPLSANVIYNPDPSEAGDVTKLYVRVYDRVCGYVADTIRIRVFPLPTDMGLELVEQPVTFQEMCEDTVYILKVKATDIGDLSNIKVRLDDVNATGIAIKDADVKYPYVSGAWETMDIIDSDVTGVTWSIDNLLPSGDSLQVRITVAAECGFFSGTNVDFYLDATSSCGDDLPQKVISSDPFFTKQDISQLNTYDVTSTFNTGIITNQTGDTVTWRLQAVVHGIQQTDEDKETFVALVPAGLTPVPDSYNPVQNAPDRTSLSYIDDEFGIEFGLPMVSGLVEGDVIIAEFKFLATGAPCGTYDFYSEVVFTDSIDCGADRCTFNSTRGGVYPTLTVERYQFSLADSIYGRTIDNLWYGNIHVELETQFFAGDSVTIDFYIDRDNDGILSSADTLVRTIYDVTRNLSPGEIFGVNFDSVYIEQEKPLLVEIHGDALCEPFIFPVATLMGVDTLCRLDTTLYYTTSGMSNYKWDVITPDGISGATPVRIPLEGSSETNYINENVARIVWKKAGDYTVWAQYSLPAGPLREIDRTFFPIKVNERPVVALTGSHDTTICIGAQVELGQFFTETTGVGKLLFYRVESDGNLTFLSDQLPLYVNPVDTALYRVTAIAGPSGCEAENFIDFYVNVNRMPHIWSVNVNEQPGCGTNTGSIKVYVTGGSSNYAYSLNGTTYTDLPADGIIGNLQAGDYHLYVRNRNWGGCPVSISESVSLSPSNSGLHASALVTDASSCTTTDGTIQLTVNGGIPPYRYRVNDGSYVSLPADGIIGTGFAAGEYTIRVLDVTNCATTPGIVQVKASSGINLVLNQQTAAACTADGLMDIVLSGGTPPYSYRPGGEGWVPMDGISETILLPAGTYKIFAKDANGCETSATGTLAGTNGLSADLIETVNVPCNGNGTGSIRLNISGTGPLKYSLDGGLTQLPAASGEFMIPDLPVGIYQVLIFDANGCQFRFESIHIGKDPDFAQAVDNRVYTYMNQSVKGQLSYDDYDFNQQALTVNGYSRARNGDILITPSGSFEYTPYTDYVGKDSVQYSIANICGFQSTAWLFINILSVNDTVNRPPIALDDDYVIKMGQSLLNFDVTTNDYDPDGDPLTTPVVMVQVLRGRLTQNGDGTFNYSPNANFTGVDIFTYRICDSKETCSTAQVHITVLPVEVFDNQIVALPDAYSVMKFDTLKVLDVSVGILNNDIYPENSIPTITITDSTAFGKLEMNHSDGTFVYTPNKDYSGFDGFSYALCTNTSAKCDTARVSIFIMERDCQVTYLIEDTISLCSNDSVNVAALILPGSLNVDTIAFFADRLHHTPVTEEYIKTAGDYYIRITSIFGCNVSDSVYIKVIPGPQPVISTGSDNACTDDRVLFITGDNFKSYQWNIVSGSGGIMDGTGTTNTEYFTWSVEGIKEVSVTVTADNNCMGTSIKTIEIVPRSETGPLYRVPNR
ncbi:MAG: tandem-95 repeat protein [Bacteroidales bacterium]|jgi:hypothetical protein|nr:tandem-95 repeat protein [Bacteroidales bacterium]